MMITAKGQIQRIAVSDIRVMGRNTQGVRLMNLDEDDALVAVKRIPKDDNASGIQEQEPEVQKTQSIILQEEQLFEQKENNSEEE
jgi:DNA gyrase subunit A